MLDYRQPSQQTQIRCLAFSELDTLTLYNLLSLRLRVFCVEQNCPYQDADGKDLNAWHVLAFQDGDLAATARILMPGESYPDACAIGRVASDTSFRGTGLGRKVMRAAIAQAMILFPDHPIRIGAQQYLTSFYQSLGFYQQGEPFLEDGIVHVTMQRDAGLAL